MPTAERYHQYEILRREDGSLWELGRGAMGITYKAYDTNLRFTVALKVINSAYLENDTARQRFLREARAAAALRHSNVASVFNLGTEQDKYFYVMEFVDGETLEARVKRKGSLEPVEALSIALQVARALAVAAKQQLVHRDLKPTNLMLVDQEGESIVKVIDFGLAKVAKDAGEDSGTLTMGGFVGTPHFASPEQVEEGEVDIRSDIYSLGATLYFVLTGQSPFSGSVGQVMSQHLYKPLPMAPLTSLPRCLVSLLQRMMEKDRNNRPQTPQELQKAILACLEEIRPSSGRSVQKTGETTSAFETLDLSSASAQPFTVGVVLAQNYKLIEELGESPQGRKFLADDLRRKRRVSLLVLSPEFLSDATRLASLEEAVQLLRNARHPMLREVFSLETVTECSFLVEEYVAGSSLLDVLRTRSVLSAPEVVRLLSLLAPLADFASGRRLRHVDLTLLGIHLICRSSTVSGVQPDLLQRPLTDWEPLEAKVDAIDFSFLPSNTATWAGSATRIQGAAESGHRGSYVRLLSLLAYELLGGPRTRLESTGQYTPIAALTQEGNAALRRALVDECSSAGELAGQLAAAVGVKGPSASISPSAKPFIPEPLPGTRPPTPPPKADVPTKRKPTVSAWRLILALGFLAIVGTGAYLVYWLLQSHEIAALSVQSEPPGAAILLDGKPPQAPPNTFTHVPLGTHQLTATLDNYEPITEEIQVRTGMSPEINLQLKPSQEIAALSIHCEPAGAAILLDGKPPQAPPNTFTHVHFGIHHLTATLDEYEPIKLDVEVRSGMNPQIHLQLKPIQEIAALSIQSEPPGASILLDGKPPQAPSNTFTHVPFGTHQLSATLDDYEPIKQDIEVSRGMNPQIHLQLKPIQEIAALSVQSEPPGALILLDGKPPQAPPNTFTHVPFGTHHLTATLDDYEPIKQDIEIRKGMTPEIRLQLKPSSIGALLREIKNYDEDSPQYLTAYVRLVQLAPSSGEYAKELGRIIERLRSKKPPISKDEFDLYYKDSIKDAAHLDILPAILWLAENANESEALTLFLQAAKLGDSYAMMKVGRLYLRKGTPEDDVEGFRWLSRAYDAPNRNLEAGAYLGDCYLSGKGTKQDVQKAEEIIMPLANQNVVPAMTLAGRILQYKAVTIRAKAESSTSPQVRKQLEAEADDLDRQARQWWERAEKDDWNASAHLGQCYEEGWGGVEKSAEEAEKRYKAGADHGNALSMFFYGLLLEKKPSRHREAEKLISRAAALGLPSAIKWCKEHNVAIAEITPEEEHQ